MTRDGIVVCAGTALLLLGLWASMPLWEPLLEPKPEPAPVAPPKALKPVVLGMASWKVTGAGDSSYNGTYAEAGTYNGKPYYVKTNPTRYLFWLTDVSRWALNGDLGRTIPPGNVAYFGAAGQELPANPWSADMGALPAPTVSAAANATANQPKYESDRRDQRVNVQKPLRVLCTFSGEYQEGLQAKLLINNSVVNTRNLSQSDFQNGYVVEFAAGTYQPAEYEVKVELYLDGELIDTSPTTTCKIEALAYDLLGVASSSGGNYGDSQRPVGPCVVTIHDVSTQRNEGTSPPSDFWRIHVVDGLGTAAYFNPQHWGERPGLPPTDLGTTQWVTQYLDVDEDGYQSFARANFAWPDANKLEWQSVEGLYEEAWWTTDVLMLAGPGISRESGYSEGDLIAQQQITFHLVRWGVEPPEPPDPPTTSLACTIVSPTDGAEVNGSEVYVQVQVSGGTGPYTVSCTFGSISLGQLTAPNFGGRYRFGPVDTTQLADGYYTIAAQATDALGAQASRNIAVHVSNEQPKPDLPPVPYIAAPENGATVSGMVRLKLEATDDYGLSAAMLYVGGVLQQSWSLSGTRWSATYDLATWDWANGNRNVTLWVRDTAGQVGYYAISLHFANGLAEGEKVIFTEQLPGVGEWHLEGANAKPIYAMMVAEFDDPPTDPRRRYNVYAGYHVPGSSVDFDDYTLVPLNRRFVLPANTQSIRFALRAVPCVDIGFWELGGVAVRALHVAGEKVYAVTWPPALYELAGAAWQQIVSLQEYEGESYRASAYADGKVFLATDRRLVALDVDAGQLPLELKLDAEIATLGALDSTVFAWGQNKLYKLTWPTPTYWGALQASVTCLMPVTSDAILAGTTDGKVLAGKPGSWTETSPPNAGAILRVAKVGNDWFAVGVNGLWRSTGTTTWQQEITSGVFRVVAQAANYAWAGGDGADLWRLGMNGWAAAHELDDVVTIWDMAAWKDALLIAVSHTDGARVYSYRYNEGGYPSGPEPPYFVAKILGYAEGVEA